MDQLFLMTKSGLAIEPSIVVRHGPAAPTNRRKRLQVGGWKKFGGLALALLLAPVVATANAGTPLMWATIAHLAVGNAVIGVLEGLLVARLLPTTRRRAVPIMVAANYVSAWIGALVLARVGSRLQLSIETVGCALLAIVVAAWLATILLEWPFVLGSAGFRRSVLLRALWISLLVQTASYLPLLAWYYAASGVSLVTRTKVVPPEEMPKTIDGDVYFIEASGGNLSRMNLRQLRATRVCELGSVNDDDRVFFEKNGEGQWDLVGIVRPEGQDSGGVTPVLPQVRGIAATERVAARQEEPGTWSNFGPASDLRPANARAVSYSTGFWSVQGLRAVNAESQERQTLSLETPLVAWPIRNVSVLPGDAIVFQLGRDQICLLHWPSMRIALIARGRGPAVLIR